MTDVVETGDTAAFESGFNDTRGNPPVEAKPEAKEPVAAEPVAPVEQPEAKDAPQPPPDPIADFRAEFDKRMGFLDKLPDRLRNIEGHIGGLTSTMKAAIAGAKAVDSKGGEAPSKAEIVTATTSSERWKRLKDDYPDWADAMDERLAEVAGSIPRTDVDGLKTEFNTNLTKQVAEAKAQARAEARELLRVDLKHDGWEEMVRSPEFKAWKAKQAPEVQALGESPKAADAIRMLDAYVASTTKQVAEKATNTQRLTRAVTPQGTPTQQPAALNDDEAFASGFKSVRER